MIRTKIAVITAIAVIAISPSTLALIDLTGSQTEGSTTYNTYNTYDNATYWTDNVTLLNTSYVFSINTSIFNENLTWDGKYLNATDTDTVLNEAQVEAYIDGDEVAFSGWDKNAANDFSGSWVDLSNIPAGFADNIDNYGDPWFNASVAATILSSWIANWNESYSWGNHSLEGYLTTESDPVYSGDPASGITAGNISNWDDAYSWGNHSLEGYLKSIGSHWHNDSYFLKSILQPWMANWNTSYGWGDHSLVGYLTVLPDHWHNDTYYTEDEIDGMGFITSETDPWFNASVASGIIQGWIDNWNTSYSWGDHSTQNYLDLDDYPNTDTDSTDDFDGNYTSLDFSGTTGLSDGVDDTGISAEADPWFNASDAFHVTSTLMDNWNTSFGWGNHAIIGYLLSHGDPYFNASDAFHVTSTLMSQWNESYSWGEHTDYYADNQTLNLTGNTFEINGSIWGTGLSFDGTFVNASAIGGDDLSDNTTDDLSDVNAPTPSKHDVLMWDGSAWVATAEGTVFTFSITSFSDGESTTQAIGSGVWKAAGAMSFTASYDNGPPSTTYINKSVNGGGYSNIGVMDGPAYTSGDNTDAINYPSAKDQYLRFRLYASDGEDSDTSTESSIYFRNYIRWGESTTSTGHSEAQIEALDHSALSNDITRTMGITAGAGDYIVFAYPTSYTQLDDGDDYEDDGATDFRFNGIACAMTHDTSTLSITTNGYTENYDVYVSDNANLGNANLVTYTSGGTINPLYYGKTTELSGFDEEDVEGLVNSEITNDNTQTWDAVTTGSGEYMLFAFPKRLGTVTFWVGGFEGGFESSETVSVTNSNGWTEDYYVWRSSNSNLGSTVVETQ